VTTPVHAQSLLCYAMQFNAANGNQQSIVKHVPYCMSNIYVLVNITTSMFESKLL